MKNKPRPRLKRVSKKNNPSKLEPIDLDLSGLLDRHIELVRPQIEELDRQNMQAMAQSPFIVVTNETKQ